MKKKDINTLMMIIFVALISFIVPNNVHAAESNSCSDKSAAFKCQYDIPDNNDHYDMQFKFEFCSNGNGALILKDYHDWNTGVYQLDYSQFLANPSLFYDHDTGVGKCPKAGIVVNNGIVLAGHTIRASTLKISYAQISCPSGIAGAFNPACSEYYVDGVESDNNGLSFYANSDSDMAEINPTTFDKCSSILGTEDYSLGWLIKKALLYLKLIGPILVLLLSAVDFIKAMIEGSDDSMKKAQKRLTTRLIVVILLILIPTIVDLLLDIFGFTAVKCNL